LVKVLPGGEVVLEIPSLSKVWENEFRGRTQVGQEEATKAKQEAQEQVAAKTEAEEEAKEALDEAIAELNETPADPAKKKQVQEKKTQLKRASGELAKAKKEAESKTGVPKTQEPLLAIDGILIDGATHRYLYSENKLIFSLPPPNDAVWKQLREKEALKRKQPDSSLAGPDIAEVVYADENGVKTPGVAPAVKGQAFKLVFFPENTVVLYILYFGIAGLVIFLGFFTNMLRDGAPWFAPDEQEKSHPWLWRLLGFPWRYKPKQPRAPFSLARVQIAFWFLLIIGGFCYLRLGLGEAPSVNNSALILMGIAGGTYAAAVTIDVTKRKTVNDLRAEQAAIKGRLKDIPTDLESAGNDATVKATLTQEQTSKKQRDEEIEAQLKQMSREQAQHKTNGFFFDIVSDENGVAIHRFQMAAWTLALGILFLFDLTRNLSMPEFSAALLGLMGISAGTYAGLKTAEQNSVPK